MSQQVEYVKKRFDLRNADEGFNFVFCFVSLAIEDDYPRFNPTKLSSDIKDMGLPALTTGRRKNGDDDDDDDNGAGDNRSRKKRKVKGGSQESDIVCVEAILAALKRAGYHIPNQVEGFDSLLPVRVLSVKKATIYPALKLTARMVHAVSAHGDQVIVKLTDEHEVEVLRRLQPARQTHIVPLLDVLDVVDGKLIVLPSSRHFHTFWPSTPRLAILGSLLCSFWKVWRPCKTSLSHIST